MQLDIPANPKGGIANYRPLKLENARSATTARGYAAFNKVSSWTHINF